MADMTVSKQWASRPDDQRFLSLEELYQSTLNRANHSTVQIVNTNALKAYGTEEDEIILNTEIGPKFFSNWSFGQVAQLAGAPSSYLKKLPSTLAAACLNDGLQKPQRSSSMIMANGNDTLRCVTSEVYGRIWDHEVVAATMNATHGGNWKVPSASYASTNPKRATTLYGSDRDVFMFLVDESNPIEINGERLFRGVIVSNSEVGAATMSIMMFLYRSVCDNRMIHGMEQKTEMRIRHTSGAPERFTREGEVLLKEYSNSATGQLVERLERAQNIKIGKDEDEVTAFLKKRGFTVATAESAIAAAKAEENEYNTVWSIAQGITAHARSYAHTDQRVALEREAGKIVEMATA